MTKSERIAQCGLYAAVISLVSGVGLTALSIVCGISASNNNSIYLSELALLVSKSRVYMAFALPIALIGLLVFAGGACAHRFWKRGQATGESVNTLSQDSLRTALSLSDNSRQEIKDTFRYLITVYAATIGVFSVLVAPEVFHLLWPFLLAPVLSFGLFALSYALRERGAREGLIFSYLNLFMPRPDFLPREMLGRLRNSMECPLYNLWRVGMVVPLCFSAAYWIVIHMIFGGDYINTRSWCLLASGGGIAILSLLFSKRLGLKNKLLWTGLTMLTYPLLFAGAMFLGIFVDVFHCFGVGWQ